ncbi:MAG: EAL domain-containing protein [Actinobacteria bacterium]|nr:EAL domain-containing protein [Actinomycetota bacterium]
MTAAPDPTAHRLTTAWIAALVAVALIAVTGWMLVDSTLVLQREAATVARVVGIQRDHIDRIQDGARAVGRAEDVASARTALTVVLDALDRVESTERQLTAGDPAGGIAGPQRVELRPAGLAVIAAGDALVAAVGALEAGVAALPPGASGPHVAALMAFEIGEVEAAEEDYERALGGLAGAYDELAATRLDEARALDRSMLLATLALLVIEALLVFLPVTRRIRAHLERGTRATEEERRHNAAQLERLARHDHLTGLSNRMAFRDRLDHAVASAERSGKHVAVMFLDLDKFKEINDSHGHDVGDQLLVAVADRLRGVARRADTIARLGGDEFVVILEGLDDAEGAATAAGKILAATADPIDVGGRQLHITTSIGIAMYPDDAGDVEDLLRHADSAMYEAKSAGRDTFRFSTPELRAVNVRRVRLISELRSAVAKQRLRLVYQPQVDVTTGELLGVEAFVRWIRPDGTEVRAGDFIGVLEDTDLMAPLGAWVLEEACRQNVAWQEAGLPPIRMAINLSGRQFRQLDLATTIAVALEETGMAADLLELEITERSLVQDADGSAATLRLLKALGVQLVIDDFGTGYSSLSYLKRFPIDVLKIDGSFVHRLDRDEDRAVPAAIAGLARHLGMGTTAEGVESREQLDVLREIGCDRAQGYHISRPLEAAQVPAFARQARIRASAGAAQATASPGLEPV